MAYILSKLSNSQVYTQYAKGLNRLNIPVKQITIKGGADVTDKNLVTPEGVVTQISDKDLDILKSNKDFQKHIEKGYIKYFSAAPDIEKSAEKMERDKSAPITPDYYKKKGKKKPKTESEQ